MSDLAVLMKGKKSKEPVVEAMKPCMYVSKQDMPNVEGMKVGDTMMIKVRVKSKTVSEKDGSDEKTSVELELASGAKSEKEDKEEEDVEEEKGSEY